MTHPMPHHPIVIIGGGIAGLMAAAHLAERGLHPLVLEADPQHVGGRLKDEATVTLEHRGLTWRFPGEHGVHGIWSPYINFKAALERWQILPPLMPAYEETWIHAHGKRMRRAPIGSAIRESPLPAPFHYVYCFLRPSFLAMLTPRDIVTLPLVLVNLFAALAIDPLAERKSLKRASLADLTKGWSPRLRSLFASLARSGLSAHPEEVPASGWIAFLRFYTLLRRDSWGFSYLPGTGGTCVSQPLAAAVKRLGGELRMGWQVTELAPLPAEAAQPHGWHLTVSHGDETHTLAAEHVILAVDAPAAERLLWCSPATRTASARLRFPRGTPNSIYRLWFGVQPRPIAEAGIFSGDVLMDNFFWLHRFQPVYNQWSKITGGSALEMHTYTSPELRTLPDDVLLARVLADTYRAFPELEGHLLHAVVQRNAATHTLFRVGEPDEHLGIQTPWPHLYACGDWVSHPTPALYLERATVTGIAAANAVLEARGHDPWPLLPHPAPEWLARWMAGVLSRERQRVLQRRQARLSGEG